ncbi:MAG TPA: cytochrome d ubiquinol oxidase subunit II [Solirubrobacteraceae bacterium]|nr:cytochrome d ubiquinol oxidase subunit II [Solirubrobacteraceae bacterium]
MLHLHTLWFVVIAIFWVGFFVLEGFDFGVGALHMLVGRNEEERRLAVSTIGPWWDGNEVWLIVAGAGTFAAFPGWYATMFSALYLALLLILAGLMARGVALEYTTRRDGERWRMRWRWALTIGSALVPLLLGVGLGDLLAGLPINHEHNFTGDFADLLTGYGLWTGVTVLALCLLHGATFLKLRTTGAVRDRARALAGPLGWVATALVLGFVIWTQTITSGSEVPDPVEVLALIAVLTAALLSSSDHDGWAFTASAVAIASTIGSIFIELYPNVMVSSTNAAFNLTVQNSASGGYALKVMTIVAVIFFPVVLLYQGWSFHVFHGRLSGPDDETGAQTPPSPNVPPSPRPDSRHSAA